MTCDLHAPTRRHLLLASGTLFAWAYLPKVARAEGRDQRLLVIVLRGALDGLAAVAPVMNGFTGPLTVGDEVIATGLRGGYSEQVIVDAADVGHKPASLGFEQAAGLLLAGCTAWHLLTATRVEKGDTVLIHGGSGGVGLFAVQLAVARDAKVIATASPARHEQLRRYGANPVEYGDGLADIVGSSQRWGVSKPDPAYFQRLIAEAGCAACAASGAHRGTRSATPACAGRSAS